VSLVETALQKVRSRGAPAKTRPETPGATAAPPIEHTLDVPPHAPQPAAPVAPVSSPSRVVIIDRDALRAVGMLPPASQERELSHQFRAIKRPLIQRASEPPVADVSPRTLMISSALPGDGKTFTSLNLALSLAMEREFRVLLVDADAPKPHLSRTFGLESQPGLLDLLADSTRRVESVIYRTDVPQLDLMPAGGGSAAATELLASARMREVAGRLAALYGRGMVLFDSPPVLLTSESRSLAAFLGQIVVVVKAGTTPQQAVRDTVQILGQPARMSLVLNHADLAGPMGYYYGYRYGYGHAQQEDGAAPDSPPAQDER
jgi:protein-tyrosine kinase